MKKYILLSCLLGVFFVSGAQDYTTGIGIRGGYSTGITIKHFIGSSTALEGIFASRWHGYNFTGLFEIDKPLNAERLHFYYGVGGHVGSWRSRNNPWFEDDESHVVIGVDGIIGLEYNFLVIPFNLSLDYKPAYNLVGHTGWWGDEGALSLRYIF